MVMPSPMEQQNENKSDIESDNSRIINKIDHEKIDDGISHVTGNRIEVLPTCFEEHADETLSCSMCRHNLVTSGGRVVLPCGDNGCESCLLHVQRFQPHPECSLCCLSFESGLPLQQVTHLQDDMETAAQASGLIQYPQVYEHKGGSETIFARPPVTDVDLWKVLRGLLAFATGSRRNKANQNADTNSSNLLSGPCDTSAGETEEIQDCTFDCTFGCTSQGTVLTDNSTDMFASPSAPPIRSSLRGQEFVRELTSILEVKPPDWMPDSGSTFCMRCGTAFRPIACFRHHCRFCGNLVCDACSRGKALLPPQFLQHDPQRVCDTCHKVLLPFQRDLGERVSNACQRALHDVTDMSSPRGWINNPLSASLQEDIFKATATLRSYSQVGRIKPEKSIPDIVLKGAVGLAIITVAKFGCLVTYKIGTGLVVARRDDGSWSAPSAITTCGVGWGFQVGAELTDFIVVLRRKEAVKAFCGHGHVSLGAGVSVAAGPLGRHVEADVRVGDQGTASCYSYSCSKGAFVGVSLEGSIVATRSEANKRFYGDESLSVSSILLGPTPRPRAGAHLYAALQDLFLKFEGPLSRDSLCF